MSSVSRTAVVTGANRGLGFAVCARLHELGHRVVVTARRGADAEAAAASIGPDVAALALDVTCPASVAAAAKTSGAVDIVINNAGILLDWGERPSSVSPELAAQHIAVNVLGAWRVSQAFLPGMRARGWGRIVMVTSGTGCFSNGLFTGAPAYSLSKAALNALTVLLAEETKDQGVLVNAVNPGMVRTRMRPDAVQTPEAAADEIVWAATLPDDSRTGTLFRHRKPALW